MKRDRLWLLLIILIGFGLRLLRLGEQSLWYDEGVTWMLSQMQLPSLIQWTADDIQPPLYYLLLWATDLLFSDSEWALRFPSALSGTLLIPLLYSLARALSGRRAAGLAPLLAAALAALSPLLVYYSQEARMYTLLVFEAALATYLLAKIVTGHLSLVTRQESGVRGQPAQIDHSPFTIHHLPFPTPFSLLYAVTAAAALYTHYFAAFLLAAHGIYALLVLWRQRTGAWRQLLAQLAWAFGGAMLLFAPWLPTLLARLGDDPSYWPGALKLNEAARKVIISFTVGETVFEQTGWQLALLYLALLLVAALWSFVTRHSSLATRQESGDRGQESARPDSQFTIHHSPFTIPSPLLPTPYSLLLLWLLLPPILILALSYQSPKFNPRYALLSWPAFALIVAATLESLRRAAMTPRRGLRWTSRGLLAVMLLLIAGIAAFSLGNWFTDPRFSKDDFKALAQFVRERKADDETVLLSSGHMFPVWAYYYGWDGWSALPYMLRLDVNRVTTPDIAGELAEALDGYGGAWLVSWQDEVIDPTGVVPFWLDRIGERPVDAGDFWGVGLEHWRLKPTRAKLLQESPIERELGLNFNGQIELAGVTQLNDDELVLFWRPLQPLPDDLLLELSLTDSDGFSWGRDTLTERPGAYLYPPSRWPVGQLVITRHRLPWQIGAPPGLYVAELNLGTVDASGGDYTGWDVLDAQGRPQRRTALVDFINLRQLVRPPGGILPQDPSPLVDMFPIIGLRRSILPQTSAQPGDRLLLALLWQAGEYNLDDVSVAFDLVDSARQVFRVGYAITPSRHFNLSRWTPGDVVLGQYWLNIPPEAAPGPAELQVHIINVGAFDYDEVFPIDQLEILPTERNFEPPAAADITLDADFSGQVTLLGVDCPHGCTAAAGDAVELKLYWRADAPLDVGYTVFTHLLGPGDAVLVNADHAPPKATQAWVPGEYITDTVTLNVPPDLPPGEYPLEIGLYNAADPAFTRLPLNDGDTRVILPQPFLVQ